MSEIVHSKSTTHPATHQAAEAKSLLIFLLVSFGFTWLVLAPAVLSAYGFLSLPVAITLLITLGTLGPFIGGVSAAAYEAGPAGMKALLSQALRWRVSPTWYAAVLAGPALVMLAAFLLWRGLGGPQLSAPPANAWTSIPIRVIGACTCKFLSPSSWLFWPACWF